MSPTRTMIWCAAVLAAIGIVYAENAVGKEGKPGTATFDLAQGAWNLWQRLWNLGAHSSCRSNTVTRIIFTIPAAPVLR
jgi:hypothetical protein